MKLVMTLLVRDEADIVRANLEHHLALGVDYIVAIDNASCDGTRDILDEFERAGSAVVIDEPGRDYSQSDWVTRAAIHARDSLGADWIINNDADEFWTTKEGSLKEVAGKTGTPIGLCTRLNMFCAYDALEESDWATRLIHRVNKPLPRPVLTDIRRDPLQAPYFYLDLPPKALVKAAGLTKIHQGNHSADFESAVEPEYVSIEIFHFPIRSATQFETKIVQGGKAYANNVNMSEGMGWHWRRWFWMYQEHGIEAALADALPSSVQLSSDLRKQRVVEDRRFLKFFDGSCH